MAISFGHFRCSCSHSRVDPHGLSDDVAGIEEDWLGGLELSSWGVHNSTWSIEKEMILDQFGIPHRSELSNLAVRNQLMPPKLSVPSRTDLAPLLEYAKPLSVVILFRFMSLTLMAKTAGTMGTAVTAAYQAQIPKKTASGRRMSWDFV